MAGYLAGSPDLAATWVGEGRWVVVLSGEIRHAIPVAVEIGTRTCTLTSFLLRGPSGEAAATLHRVLLRKERGLLRARFCLDADDDVLLLARIPLADLDAQALDETLGELLSVSESSFEALVHLGYPGVFPPLPRCFASSDGHTSRHSAGDTNSRSLNSQE